MPFPKRQARIVAAAHLVAGFLFLSPSYIRPDSVGVYSYLRSMVVSGDLLFFDEWAGFQMLGDGFAYFKEVTPVGALANHWWVGTSLLSAPAYLVSHLLSVVLPGEMFPADGFFGLDLATLGWTSVLFHALALISALMIVRQLNERTETRLVVIALVCMSLGTPAFWYAFRMPLGTHAAGMMLVGLLTLLCLRPPDDDGHYSFYLGFVLGLAIVTRLQHVVLFPAVLFAMIRARRSPRDYLLAASGGLLPLLAQGAAWHAIYGNPLGPLVAGANLEGVTWMPFERLAFLPVLFSSWRGLFVWSPIWLIGIAGWVLLVRSEPRVRRSAGIICMVMFAGELFANATLDRYWWGGMSFGPRRFVDLAVPVAIGIWAFAERSRLTGVVLSVFATAWSCLLMLAASAGTLDLSRHLDFPAIFTGIREAFSHIGVELLHSPVTSKSLFLQSIIAILILSALVALVRLAYGRHVRLAPVIAPVWIGVCLIAILGAVTPTRARAQEEKTRFTLDTEAARSAGPLIDQKGLISHELDWLEATGRDRQAAETREEIRRIDEELDRLTLGR